MADTNVTFPIVALVCGILSFIPWAGIALGIVAIIFGSLALKNIKREPAKYSGRGMALAGLIIGIVGLIFTVTLAIIAIVALTYFARAAPLLLPVA